MRLLDRHEQLQLPRGCPPARAHPPLRTGAATVTVRPGGGDDQGAGLGLAAAEEPQARPEPLGKGRRDLDRHLAGEPVGPAHDADEQQRSVDVSLSPQHRALAARGGRGVHEPAQRAHRPSPSRPISRPRSPSGTVTSYTVVEPSKDSVTRTSSGWSERRRTTVSTSRRIRRRRAPPARGGAGSDCTVGESRAPRPIQYGRARGRT